MPIEPGLPGVAEAGLRFLRQHELVDWSQATPSGLDSGVKTMPVFRARLTSQFEYWRPP